MKLLVLGAGYATRLYPLTLHQPKALLPVAGKPMMEHVLEALTPYKGLDEILVVTNAKFAPHFEAWAKTYRKKNPALTLTIVNDQSTSEENRLGAIGDIDFVVRQRKIDTDLVVVAGDNLFNQPLHSFLSFCEKKQAPVLGVYDVKSLEEIKKYGCITLTPQGHISSFEEKPQHPQSTWAGIALYYYPRAILPSVHQYLEEANNPDQPGRLIQWLYKKTPVYTWQVPGLWFDIGSQETLEEANTVFSSANSASALLSSAQCIES